MAWVHVTVLTLYLLIGFLCPDYLALGEKETKCYALEGTIIACEFPRNVNSSRTDFAVYYQENVYEELLADCAWANDHLQCIEQEGVWCKQPVSETVDVKLPTRYVNRSGTYKCIPDGSTPEHIKSCQFQHKGQQEGQQKAQGESRPQKLNGNEALLQKKEATKMTMEAIGIVLGVVAEVVIASICLIILCKKVHKKGTQQHPSNQFVEVPQSPDEEIP